MLDDLLWFSSLYTVSHQTYYKRLSVLWKPSMHMSYTAASTAIILLWLWSSLASAAAFDAELIGRVDLKSLLTASSNNWSSTTTISFPGSPTFVNETERWTLFDEPTYSAVVSPGTETDLVTVVSESIQLSLYDETSLTCRALLSRSNLPPRMAFHFSRQELAMGTPPPSDSSRMV